MPSAPEVTSSLTSTHDGNPSLGSGIASAPFTRLQVDDIDLRVEGPEGQTLLFLHGWPDTLHLWDNTVAALKDRFRCVRFTLPGFDLAQPARPTALADMTRLIQRIAAACSPDAPVTLVMHDWGCIFGYEFAARHPELVARIVAVDIGDHNSGAYLRSLTAKAKWQIFGYQMWLALAWKLGSTLSTALGNRMTRSMAGMARCPNPPSKIGWQMNYPYAMQWLGLLGGFKGAARVQPACPVLYLYGTRKLFMFHSSQWLEQLNSRPGCRALGLRTGHWVMVDQPDAFVAAVRNWLKTATD